MSQRLRRFILQDGVIGTQIFVFIGPYRALEQYAHHVKGEIPKDLAAHPGAVWTWTAEGHEVVCCFLRDVPRTPSTIGVLAHEGFHVVARVAEIVGIPVSSDTEEWCAYYLHWFIDQVLRRTQGRLRPCK